MNGVVTRANTITSAPHWYKTFNILELSNIDRDAWNLSDLIQKNNEEAKEQINTLKESQYRQEREPEILILRYQNFDSI